LVVTGVAFLARRQRPGAVESDNGLLGPGVYLFTSSTCADCVAARQDLVDNLGGGAFTEIEWERDPEAFTRAGIDVVPTTVVVAEDGTATRFPGKPDSALSRFNP
jgi:hypothetical protein